MLLGLANSFERESWRFRLEWCLSFSALTSSSAWRWEPHSPFFFTVTRKFFCSKWGDRIQHLIDSTFLFFKSLESEKVQGKRSTSIVSGIFVFSLWFVFFFFDLLKRDNSRVWTCSHWQHSEKKRKSCCRRRCIEWGSFESSSPLRLWWAGSVSNSKLVWHSWSMVGCAVSFFVTGCFFFFNQKKLSGFVGTWSFWAQHNPYGDMFFDDDLIDIGIRVCKQEKLLLFPAIPYLFLLRWRTTIWPPRLKESDCCARLWCRLILIWSTVFKVWISILFFIIFTACLFFQRLQALSLQVHWWAIPAIHKLCTGKQVWCSNRYLMNCSEFWFLIVPLRKSISLEENQWLQQR